MDQPPPPPPHGNMPRSSNASPDPNTNAKSNLPPGKYDIFIIPPHSSGSGFLYLPSLKPNLNSFAAGFASALVLVVLAQTMGPVSALGLWEERNTKGVQDMVGVLEVRGADMALGLAPEASPVVLTLMLVRLPMLACLLRRLLTDRHHRLARGQRLVGIGLSLHGSNTPRLKRPNNPESPLRRPPENDLESDPENPPGSDPEIEPESALENLPGKPPENRLESHLGKPPENRHQSALGSPPENHLRNHLGNHLENHLGKIPESLPENHPRSRVENRLERLLERLHERNHAPPRQNHLGNPLENHLERSLEKPHGGQLASPPTSRLNNSLENKHPKEPPKEQPKEPPRETPDEPAKAPPTKGAWEKAREEVRRKEEERKAQEAEQRRREEVARRLKELREKEARERARREQEARERKERETHEKEAREKEQREKEEQDRIQRERQQRENRIREARERELRERLERERALREKLEREFKEREAIRAQEAAEAARLKEAEAARQREAEAARLREAEATRRREAEAEAARQREAEAARKREAEAARLREIESARLRGVVELARQREAEAERQREAEAARQREIEAEQEAEAAKLKEAESIRRGTYAYSSVGEKTNPWPNGKPSPRPPSPPRSTTTASTTPTKHPPVPSPKAATVTDEEIYSYRPYDQPKKHTRRKSGETIFTESSYAPSQSTSRTTPPPSMRAPYATKDPDKIVIKAVYGYLNQFSKTPASQLISGFGSVTDGLILRITTEGIFIDDDVRGVPQREWDVKAWTLKTMEIWCPAYVVNESNATPKAAPRPTAHRFRSTIRGQPKTLLGEEADACLAELLHSCKDECRLGPHGGHDAASSNSASSGLRGPHVLRATIKDQDGKRYVFVLEEEEGWKVALGLQRLRKGTQVRQLGIQCIPKAEAQNIVEMLGW
ncbi:hypothetical protein GGS23DRAFT_614561 [Durotheca rogersii]|uniref:uncharacterized protein n=1 Tax=Durotheca rogersii TaxID=419775 RepID=UPI002220BFC9|nr:uncharacterized protein GGS23DRAFT_614561 [Durotheca rogersii]KAI5860028.1 hypothetical protein GGS23DRAFT_614561 [Durotheca rogersii]